jgi:quercetin dioxygenase-like cupin family protein
VTGDAPAGEERLLVRAGDFFFLPAAIEHGIDNVGDEDLELVVVGAHALGAPRGLSGSGA